MGRPRNHGRDIDGIILLDKPQGISSNSALQKVKRIFNANKAGHTGALDPLATGMLPICLGEATKFSQFLLDADKQYRVIARLGQRTNTSDSDGELIAERDVAFSHQELEIALGYFRGELTQTPSVFSALKHEGRPLYEYARQGIEVPKKVRQIVVFRLDLVRCTLTELELEVHCSKGTYIRTIIDDLGEMLGCGAHVTYLRRLQVANYPVENMVALTQLESLLSLEQDKESVLLLDSLLLPVDSAIRHIPEVNLNLELAYFIKQGQVVKTDTILQRSVVRITEGEDRRFIGIGSIDHGLLAPKRLLAERLPF